MLVLLPLLSILSAGILTPVVHSAHGAVRASRSSSWPNGPLLAKGARMTDASGQNVTFAGANWPGSADVMIPEGLQYQSVATIVGRLKDLGMNAVRLTWATQMVDDVYANNGRDVTVRDAFVAALGQGNGNTVYQQVLAKNPAFSDKTTRLQVFDAVAAECAKQEIYVHLDNHISKGTWCCSTDDGNAWWGDKHFAVSNWTRGLTFMAQRGKSWPALMSMSLRNEPRKPKAAAARATYDWAHWYAYAQMGAGVIGAAHPSVLVFLSGLDFDTTLTPVVRGAALTSTVVRRAASTSTPTLSNARFSRSDFPGLGDRLVFELHNYATSTRSCASLQSSLQGAGFEAMDETAGANAFPVVLSEWGLKQDSSAPQSVYANCLATYLPAKRAGWMIWALTGSYYIREGKQDYDEEWGLLNHDWSSWRSPDFVDKLLKPMAKNTIGGYMPEGLIFPRHHH